MHPPPIHTYMCVHVARQYKEASRLASETKALNSILESEQETKRRVEDALVERNKELSTATRELATIKEELNTVEEEEGT